MSSGGFSGGGRGGWDCCRLPGQDLWEDLQCSFPFSFEFFFNKVVPLDSLERKGWW